MIDIMNIILGRSFLSVKLIIKRENKTIAIPALENDSNRHSDDIHNEITIRILSFLSLKTVLQYNMAMIPIYFSSEPILVSPKLKGVLYDSMGQHSFMKAYLED